MTRRSPASPYWPSSETSPFALSASSLRRSGVTLIEMLIAVALTLLVVLAMVRAFDLLGSNVTDSRSILELSAQMRTVATQLQKDLDMMTLIPNPPADPESQPGYFEITEGFLNDNNSYVSDTDPTFANPLAANHPGRFLDQFRYVNNAGDISRYGDVDDIIAFTVRSNDEPFTGRFNGQVITSNLAEVIWWVERTAPVPPFEVSAVPATPTFTLHRRVLLILPEMNANPTYVSFLNSVDATNIELMRMFHNENDLSVRLHYDISGNPVGLRANSLEDLSDRRNRFAHNPYRDLPGNSVYQFPNELIHPFALLNSTNVPGGPNLAALYNHPKDLPVRLISKRGLRKGDDLMLSDVLAFDIRVFDPKAPIDATSLMTLAPGDPAYVPPGPTVRVHRGAYVDLNYLRVLAPNQTSFFAGPPSLKSRLGINPNVATYCTWSTTYETDGMDQDGDSFIDEGTNGLNDPVVGRNNFVSPYDPAGQIVDDPGESETEPPYPHPLTGVEITIRAEEFSSQQVRQIRVIGDFRQE